MENFQKIFQGTNPKTQKFNEFQIYMYINQKKTEGNLRKKKDKFLNKQKLEWELRSQQK